MVSSHRDFQRCLTLIKAEQGAMGGEGCRAQPDKMGVSFTPTVVLPEEVKAVLDSSFVLHFAAQQRRIQRKESGCSCALNQAVIMNSIFLIETHTLSKKQCPLKKKINCFQSHWGTVLSIQFCVILLACSCYVQHLCLFKIEASAMSKRTWLKDILFLQDLWAHCLFLCVVIFMF